MVNNKGGLIIAIDGHSSTGKSTFAKLIAKRLNYIYVDSGAMYRAVTLHCMEKGLFDGGDDPAVALVVAELPHIFVSFRRNPETGVNETCLNDRVVEKEIRTMAVSDHVSYISTIAEVRKKMVALQREIGTEGGVVMDGRDIGTVVYPHADIKIFMTAGVEVRAERRRKELEEKGIEEDFEKVKKNIADRDRIDSGRETSPLKQADDAVILDNSEMTIPEQMDWFIERFGKVLQS
ncbi:MAG: (d)CMP kinase [Bacteroidales bacterium]